MFFLAKDVETQDLGKGAKRKIVAHSGALMAVEVHMEAGAVGAMHSHPHEQITYVHSGVFEFTIGDDKKTVVAGDSMYQSPNLIHGCVCIEAGMLIDIFTPQREDFLKK